MKRILLSTVFLYMISILGASAQNTSISLKIKYMDGEKMVLNNVVYLLYQEPEKPELVEKMANTGNSGEVVNFQVPLDKDGASFPFVILFTKEDIDKAKEMVKTTTIRAYRTPPGENCESLQLTIKKGGSMGNDGCAIQMWSMGKE